MCGSAPRCLANFFSWAGARVAGLWHAEWAIHRTRRRTFNRSGRWALYWSRRRTLNRPRRRSLYGPGWRTLNGTRRWSLDRSARRTFNWSGWRLVDGSGRWTLNWSRRRAFNRALRWSVDRSLPLSRLLIRLPPRDREGGRTSAISSHRNVRSRKHYVRDAHVVA